MNAKSRLPLSLLFLLWVPLLLRAEDTGQRPSHALGASAFGDVTRVGFKPLPGIAQPASQVTMSAPLEGMLMEVCVREGQRVELGEILAVIDNRVASAAVDVARAASDRSGAIQQAREERNFTEILVERQLQLKQATGGSDFELLEARTRFEQAKAALLAAEQDQHRAQETLELELARLEAHNIRAPFAGQVLRLHAVPGATITRDDQLLTIIRVDELKADLYVSWEHYQQLQVGNEYLLTAGPPLNRPVPARLEFVAPVIDAATRTFRVVFLLDNHDQKLPAGFALQLDAQALSRQKTLVGTP